MIPEEADTELERIAHRKLVSIVARAMPWKFIDTEWPRMVTHAVLNTDVSALMTALGATLYGDVDECGCDLYGNPRWALEVVSDDS